MQKPEAGKYEIKLPRVRIAFPVLFEARSFQNSEPRFSATFLLDPKKHAAEIKTVKEKTQELIAERWKGDDVSILRVPLRDGNTKKKLDGYAGNQFIVASSPANKRPVILARNRNLLTRDDGTLYGGCYVIASIELWAQSNEYGKAINTALRAVQFYADGTPFSGGTPVNIEDEFEVLDEEEDTALARRPAFMD